MPARSGVISAKRPAGTVGGDKTFDVLSGSEEVRRYAWIHRSAVRDAGCLTLVHDVDAWRVARSFGADPRQGRVWDFEEYCEEAFARADKQSLIGVRPFRDWTLVAEESRFEGIRSDVLDRVSRGAQVVSVYWDIDGTTRFSHAVNGRVRTAFEAVLPEYRCGTDPDALETERAGLPWHDAEEVPLMLALAARVTGCELGPEWLGGTFLTCPVTTTTSVVRGFRAQPSDAHKSNRSAN